MLWGSTCVTVTAVGVSVVIVNSVLCRESHAYIVGQDIRQVTREVTGFNGVIFGRTFQ